MKKKLLITGGVHMLLWGILAAVWVGCDWPPPRLILKYGFPPAGGPTGRRLTVEGIEFIELRPAYIQMGSHYLCNKGDALGRVSALFGLGWGSSPCHAQTECPKQWREIDYCIWLAATELTEEQYSVSGKRAQAPRKEHPVTEVNWHAAADFCSRLASMTGFNASLPSEREWEYACRAGERDEFAFGTDARDSRKFAWSRINSGLTAQPVGRLRPNRWGFHDMHGNVREWCSGPHCPRSKPGNPVPQGQNGQRDEAWLRVLKGGCFLDAEENCRSACRVLYNPMGDSRNTGLRPMLRVVRAVDIASK